MRKFGLLLASFLAAPQALAQQYAAQTVCAIPLDGGTGSVTTTCGPVLLNYQPFSVNCVLGPNYETVQGTTKVLVSGDGVHFGVPSVAGTQGGVIAVVNPDGGVLNGSGSAFGPIGNAAGTATVVAATDVFDITANPTDPYLYAEISVSAKSDGGTSDAVNCYFSVIQSQTLHAPHGIVKAAGVKVVK